MGCVSSNLLNQDEELSQLGGSAFANHIVNLTSTTYGFLSLDPPPSPPPSSAAAVATPMTPPERLTVDSVLAEPTSLWSEPRLIRSEPEVINSWELMSGLDADSFRFSPIPRTPVKITVSGGVCKENSDPNRRKNPRKQQLGEEALTVKKPLDPKFSERFQKLCPPGGENRIVIYTTSLRGVRRTFEACNAVRSAVESFGVAVCERDVSMDRGYREELRSLMSAVAAEEKPRNPNSAAAIPPRVFVDGRFVGGAEEVLRLVDEGMFGELVRGLPRKCGGARGDACDGCGGVGFVPCFRCSGSCKVVEGWRSSAVVVRCTDCNENGLVLCPICR